MIDKGIGQSRLFGINIWRGSLAEMAELIKNGCASQDRNNCVVVTPNVDHLVMLDTDEDFRGAYKIADYRIADGWPIWLTSVIVGKALPGTIPGSDLVPAVFQRICDSGSSARVFILGGMPGVAELAANEISCRYSRIKISGFLAPDFSDGFDPALVTEVCASIAASKSDILLVGLGAPKQEYFSTQNKSRFDTKFVLCIGGTIDFFAGVQRRAPLWVRRLGLEWLYRAVSNPRRLGRRYARDLLRFPVIFLREVFLS